MNKKILLSMSVLCTLFAAGHAFAAQQEELDPQVLAEMNVTALGYEKSNLETPADVTVYTSEDLKKTGASDVANALKYKAGVYFTQMGPHDQSWITGNSTLSLRGVKGGTLVLINGVPASFNNVSHLDMMNLDTVEKVEVVKGGGAVLYGSEAYGGVINVITKDSYKNSVHVAAGNKGQRDYSATIGAGKLGLSFGRNEMGETGIISQKIGSKKFDGSNFQEYYTGFGDSRKDHIDISYKFDDKLQLNYMFNKKKYTTNYLSANEEILQHFMYDDREHFAQLHFNDQSGLDATAYYNERAIRNPDYSTADPSILEWERSKHKNYGADVKKVWENKDDKILIGFNTKRELYVDENQKFVYNTLNLKPFARFGTYALNGYSLYGQYDRKLSDATNVIFSMREDMVRSDAGDYNAFLPQLQAITKLDEQNSLYANIGRSFRMPTFRQLYYSSGMIASNPDLKPEYGWNYEAGYKHDNGKEQFKAAVFHIDLDDQIASRKVNGLSQSYNASKYKNTGVEVSYTKAFNDDLSWTVGGIYSNPQNKTTDSDPWKDVLGKYQVMTSVDYQHDKTSASLNLSYMGGRVNNNSQDDVKPILLSNVHVGYGVWKNATLTLDVNNIFNRRDLTDPDNKYYTQGRTFLVGMNYSF